VLCVQRIQHRRERQYSSGSYVSSFEVEQEVQRPVIVLENDCQFEFDIRAPPFEGWEFGLRESRTFLSRLCNSESKVLDIYSHFGELGVQCAVRAQDVLMVDNRLTFSSIAETNLARNNVAHKGTALHRTDIPAELRRLADSNMRFDVVSITFRPELSRHDSAQGHFGENIRPSMKGHKEMIQLASPLIADGGHLFVSEFLPTSESSQLKNMVKMGLTEGYRKGYVIWESGASPDCGVVMGHDEFWYPRGLCVRVV